MCMIMVFGALLEFTLVNYLANKKMLKSRLPDIIKVPGFVRIIIIENLPKIILYC